MKTAVKKNSAEMVITVEEPLPSSVRAGDAVENADFYPSVVFRNNIVHHDSAPGIGKMGCVRSGGVYAPCAFPDHDSAAFHMKVLRSLDQQGHA